MDRYGMSPLEMMSLIGPMFIVLPMLLWFLVIGPLILYPVARWRAAREPYMDPQLGMKVALHYFRLLAFQILLMGGAVLIWTIISKGGDKGSFYRAAFGFLVPAAIVFGAHTVLLKKTNDEVVPGVRRLFLGYNLLVTGLLGFIALVLGFQALFAKGSSGDAGRMFLATILVYCSAWAGIGVLFSKEVLGAGSSTAPPQNLAPPAPMAGPTAATPGLPPLAAPSFPPIDPRGSE
jgi:hypothetical protein